MTESRVKAGGASTPDTLGVRLFWWKLPSTSADKAWSIDPPECRQVDVDVLGVWSPRKTYFTVHAVLPKEPLPPMNGASKSQFVRTARKILVDRIHIPIHGLNPDIVEWSDPYDADIFAGS